MIALLLALAAPQASPPRLICTHELSGRRVQGRIIAGRVEIRKGRRRDRWRALPAQQIEWSCVPADGRRYPESLD